MTPLESLQAAFLHCGELREARTTAAAAQGVLGGLGGLCERQAFSHVTENEVAKQILDAAYRVHTSLGPGLLDSACEAVLAFELEN